MRDAKAKTEAEQLDFFEQAHRAFERACEKAVPRDHFFCLAGATIRIRFAGERLVTLLVSALEHLRIPATRDSDFTICVWESATTDVEMPRINCNWDRFTNRGDIWGFDSVRIRTAFHWVENSIVLMDLHSNTAIYWVECADRMPFWVHASPLRTVFHWCMETRGNQLIHAAAVGNDAGAVLITGKGGVGKSTTALAALRGGLDYIGDDYLVVALEPEPTVYSLYCTAKLNAAQVANLPEYGGLVTNTHALDEEKAVMFLHEFAPDRIRRQMPLRAILIPRITSRAATGFSAADPDAAQRASAFTTLSQLPYAGRRTHEFLHRLSRSLPTFYIELGFELDRIPSAIATFLQQGCAQLRGHASEKSTMSDELPLISVIIPTFNGERFIADAIDSVLAQKYPALEIIVVDDGSSDGTERLIESLPADIRYYRQQENRGPAAARNVGIRDAAGEYIAFLDVDDYWPEGNLAYLLQEIRAGGDLVVYGHAQVMRYRAEKNDYEYAGSPEDAFPYYIGSGLYRRSAFRSVGLFDEELRFGEDMDWYTRAQHQGLQIRRLRDVTLFVRRHGGNMTHGKTQAELNPLRLFKKALDRRRGGPAGDSRT